MMIIAIRLVITAASIWVAAQWAHGISLIYPAEATDLQKAAVLVGIAVVFTVVNALVKPVIKFFSFPLIILSLGLFLLIVNGLMLELTAAITHTTKYGLAVDSFGAAVWGAIIITVVNWALGVFVPNEEDRG